jgi:hypothetical protein
VSRNPAISLASHPRPVGEAPVENLIDRADDLARRWAIALILSRPLRRIGELPLEDLARAAPALCAQAIRALLSDAELDRMAGSCAAGSREESAYARELAKLAGARDAEAAVAAVEALRAVLWGALLEELRDPPARQVADLADRLAYVCATALSVTLAAPLPVEASVPLKDADRAVATGARDGDLAGAEDRTVRPSGAVLIDERDEAQPAQATSRPLPSASERRTQVRPFPWDMGPFESRENVTSAPAGGPEIEITDARREDRSPAWTSPIGRRIERFEEDGLPFGVLLVELFDVERLERVVPPGELSALTSEVEGALAHELRMIERTHGARPGGPSRRTGALTRERPGRYWLLAPSDRLAVRMLAERLARALGPLAHRGGVALPFAIGTAVCPEDGRDAAALAARAEARLFDARAGARSSASVDRLAEDLDLSG